MDGSSIHGRMTGVGRYTAELARHGAGAGVDYVVLTNRHDTGRLVASGGQDTPAVSRAWLRPTLAWLQLMAPVGLRRLRCRIGHFTTGRRPLLDKVPAVVTVHDVTVISNPGLYHRREQLLTAPWLRRSIAGAAAVIVVSKDTRRELLRLFPAGIGGPVHVIPEAPGDAFRAPVSPGGTAAARARHDLGPRYWLSLGAITPRKNPLRLVTAFAVARLRVGTPPPRLVVAGPGGPLQADLDLQIRRLGLDDAVRLVGWVPGSELPALMAGAELLACPSLHEGFGLPVVEALAVGTPVVASVRGALPEVAGDAAVYVDPMSTTDIVRGLETVGASSMLQRRLADQGRRRAQRWSWAATAAATAEVYRSVISSDWPLPGAATEMKAASPPTSTTASPWTTGGRSTRQH